MSCADWARAVTHPGTASNQTIHYRLKPATTGLLCLQESHPRAVCQPFGYGVAAAAESHCRYKAESSPPNKSPEPPLPARVFALGCCRPQQTLQEWQEVIGRNAELP